MYRPLQWLPLDVSTVGPLYSEGVLHSDGVSVQWWVSVQGHLCPEVVLNPEGVSLSREEVFLPPSCVQNDTCFWKHYLPLRSVKTARSPLYMTFCGFRAHVEGISVGLVMLGSFTHSESIPISMSPWFTEHDMVFCRNQIRSNLCFVVHWHAWLFFNISFSIVKCVIGSFCSSLLKKHLHEINENRRRSDAELMAKM